MTLFALRATAVASAADIVRRTTEGSTGMEALQGPAASIMAPGGVSTVA
jgi:hypothetical protein